jgi:hypothetical protein
MGGGERFGRIDVWRRYSMILAKENLIDSLPWIGLMIFVAWALLGFFAS